MATKNADPSPTLFLVLSLREGLSHFPFTETPSTGPGVMPVLGYVTLVPGFNLVDSSRIKTTQTMAEFFGCEGGGVVLLAEADLRSELRARCDAGDTSDAQAVTAKDPKAIATCNSVPALRYIAQLLPEHKAAVERRIEFFRAGSRPVPEGE